MRRVTITIERDAAVGRDEPNWAKVSCNWSETAPLPELLDWLAAMTTSLWAGMDSGKAAPGRSRTTQPQRRGGRQGAHATLTVVDEAAPPAVTDGD